MGLFNIGSWFKGSEKKAKPTPIVSAKEVKHELAKLQIKPPANIEELVDCIEKDPQFLLGTMIIKSMCLSATITFECESKDPRHQAVKKALEALWLDVKSDTMDAFGYGRVAFHKRWGAYDPKTNIRMIRCLDALPFKQTEMKLTDDGDYDGVLLKVDESNPKHIGPMDSWWLAIDADAKEPHGKSQFLGAPLETWKDRRTYAKRIDTYDEKQAGGAYFLKAPAEIDGGTIGKGDLRQLDDAGNLIDGVADAARAAASLKSGGILAVASGTHGDGAPLYEFTQVGTAGDSSHIQSRKVNLDDDALKSLGIPPKALDNPSGVGTYGSVDSYRQTLASRCEQFLQQIVTSFQRYVIDKVLEYNFAPDARPKIEMKLEPIYNPDMGALLMMVQAIVTSPSASPFIRSGLVDIVALLKRVKIEGVTDIQGAMARIEAMAKEATAQPAFGGGRFALSLSDSPPKVSKQTSIEDDAVARAKAIVANLPIKGKDRPKEGDVKVLL